MIGATAFEIEVPPTFLDPQHSDDAVGSWGETVGHVHLSDASFERHDPALERARDLLDAMIERSRREVERFPASGRVRVNLGVALLNSGHIEEASSQFEVAVALDPRSHFAAASLGRVRLRQGRIDEAQELFLRAREIRPQDPAPVVFLAEIALQREDITEAVRLLEQAVALDPTASFARSSLGLVFLKIGRPKDAITHLREAVRTEQRSAHLHCALGVAFAEAGEGEKAIQAFQTALALSPGLSDAIHGLAEVLVRERRLDEAIGLLEDLLSACPDDRESRELLAWSYFQSGDYKSSRSQLMKIIGHIDRTDFQAMAHQARLINNLGACFWLLGNHDDAQRQFARAIELSPDAPVPYHSLARLLVDEHHPERALPVLDACQARGFPNDEETRLLKVVALEALGRHDDAISVLKGWVDTQEASTAAWSWLGRLLADVKRQPDVAVEVMSEARRRFPLDPIVANNLAYAYLMCGEAPPARTVLESVPASAWKSMRPEVKVVLHATRGLLHLYEGDARSAELGYREAEEAAERRGFFGLARAARRKKHIEFARAYLRSGNPEAARSEVQRGLAVAGNDPYHYRRELRELARELRSPVRLTASD